MPGPSQRSQLFKCLPQGREHTCIGEHAASFLGKVAIKKWSKIGEVFLFPPKKNSDIEDVHVLLNLNFPCFFSIKITYPAFPDVDDF